jgi:hypothetical protein
MTDTLYANFHDPTESFRAEPRAFCYELATPFVTEARQEAHNNWYDHIKTVEGVLLLLFTWNFAARETKKLNFDNVRNLIKRNKKDLKRLEQVSVESAGADIWDVIKKVFRRIQRASGTNWREQGPKLIKPASICNVGHRHQEATQEPANTGNKQRSTFRTLRDVFKRHSKDHQGLPYPGQTSSSFHRREEDRRVSLCQNSDATRPLPSNTFRPRPGLNVARKKTWNWRPLMNPALSHLGPPQPSQTGLPVSNYLLPIWHLTALLFKCFSSHNGMSD